MYVCNAMKIFSEKVIKTLGRIFVPPIRIFNRMFEIKTQLIDTYNKILTHRCLYMEDITINIVLLQFTDKQTNLVSLSVCL